MPLNPLLSNAPRRRGLTPVLGLADPGVDAVTSSDMGRGAATGALGLQSGFQALRADYNQAQGDVAGEQAAREELARLNEQQQLYAPRTGSIADVEDAASFGQYVKGGLGQGLVSMAPAIGSAVLGRGLGVGAATGAFAGSVVPQAGEISQRLQSDPEAVARTSAAERLALSAGGAIPGALLESRVPGGVVGGIGKRVTARGVAEDIVRKSAEEAATEGAQTLIGQGVHSLVNENRNRAGDAIELADAAILGGLTGGAVRTATTPLDAVTAGVERLPLEKLEKLAGRKPRRTADARIDNIAGRTTMPPDVAREAINDPAVGVRWMEENDQLKQENVASLLDEALARDDLSPETRAEYEALRAGEFGPEAMREAARLEGAQRAAEFVREAVSELGQAAKGYKARATRRTPPRTTPLAQDERAAQLLKQFLPFGEQMTDANARHVLDSMRPALDAEFETTDGRFALPEILVDALGEEKTDALIDGLEQIYGGTSTRTQRDTLRSHREATTDLINKHLLRGAGDGPAYTLSAEEKRQIALDLERVLDRGIDRRNRDKLDKALAPLFGDGIDPLLQELEESRARFRLSGQLGRAVSDSELKGDTEDNRGVAEEDYGSDRPDFEEAAVDLHSEDEGAPERRVYTRVSDGDQRPFDAADRHDGASLSKMVRELQTRHPNAEVRVRTLSELEGGEQFQLLSENDMNRLRELQATRTPEQRQAALDALAAQRSVIEVVPRADSNAAPPHEFGHFNLADLYEAADDMKQSAGGRWEITPDKSAFFVKLKDSTVVPNDHRERSEPRLVKLAEGAQPKKGQQVVVDPPDMPPGRYVKEKNVSRHGMLVVENPAGAPPGRYLRISSQKLEAMAAQRGRDGGRLEAEHSRGKKSARSNWATAMAALLASPDLDLGALKVDPETGEITGRSRGLFMAQARGEGDTLADFDFVPAKFDENFNIIGGKTGTTAKDAPKTPKRSAEEIAATKKDAKRTKLKPASDSAGGIVGKANRLMMLREEAAGRGPSEGDVEGQATATERNVEIRELEDELAQYEGVLEAVSRLTELRQNAKAEKNPALSKMLWDQYNEFKARFESYVERLTYNRGNDLTGFSTDAKQTQARKVEVLIAGRQTEIITHGNSGKPFGTQRTARDYAQANDVVRKLDNGNWAVVRDVAPKTVTKTDILGEMEEFSEDQGEEESIDFEPTGEAKVSTLSRKELVAGPKKKPVAADRLPALTHNMERALQLAANSGVAQLGVLRQLVQAMRPEERMTLHGAAQERLRTLPKNAQRERAGLEALVERLGENLKVLGARANVGPQDPIKGAKVLPASANANQKKAWAALDALRARFEALDKPSPGVLARLDAANEAVLDNQLDRARAMYTTVNDWVKHQAAVAQAEPETAGETNARQDDVNVWHGSGENSVLSNLAQRPFSINGRHFISVEHAYQTLKSGTFDENTYAKYTEAGRKIPGRKGTKTDNNWNVRLMEKLVATSFRQNPDAMAALKATGSARITHTQDKGVWASEFPRILMQVRDTAADTPAPEAPAAQTREDFSSAAIKARIARDPLAAKLSNLQTSIDVFFLEAPTSEKQEGALSPVREKIRKEWDSVFLDGAATTPERLDALQAALEAVTKERYQERVPPPDLAAENKTETPDAVQRWLERALDAKDAALKTQLGKMSIAQLNRAFDAVEAHAKRVDLDHDDLKKVARLEEALRDALSAAEDAGEGAVTERASKRSDKELSDDEINALMSEAGESAQERQDETEPAPKAKPKAEPKARKPASAELKAVSEQAIKDLLDGVETRWAETINDDPEIEGLHRLYEDGREVIELALGALNPLSVAHHESMHSLFSRMEASKDEAVKRAHSLLVKQMQNPEAVRALKALFAGNEAALEQMGLDTELDPGSEQFADAIHERMAYWFQSWMMGEVRANGLQKGFFKKIVDMLRKAIGMMSEPQKVDEFMAAFADGRMKTPGAMAEAFESLEAREKALERFARAVSPVTNKLKDIALPAADALRLTKDVDLVRLARLFNNEEADDDQGLGFLPATDRARNIWTARWMRSVEDATEQEIAAASKILNEVSISAEAPKLSGNENIDRIVTSTIKTLRQLHRYQSEADVRIMRQHTDARTGKKFHEWVPLPKVDHYFPRVWDFDAISQRADQFKALLLQPKYAEALKELGDEDQSLESIADTIVARLLSSDPGEVGALAQSGTEGNLSEGEGRVGYTPWAQHTNNRALSFIEAGDFKNFLDKDLGSIMSTYIHQATKRAEYARRFRYDGIEIQSALNRAMVRMTKGDNAHNAEAVIRYATRNIQAMEGTLGADIDPKLRSALGAATVYQNIRLMPLALFAQIIDPVAIMARGGELADAWSAFKRGAGEVISGWTGKQVRDEATRVAETLGTVESEMTNAMLGEAFGGTWMQGTSRKLNDQLFRVNGMRAWNRGLRVAATQTALKVIPRYAELARKGDANGKRWLKEIGLKAEDVKVVDGRMAFERGDGLDAEQTKRVQQAVYRWVNGAVLRPNAAQRPTLASDPHWAFLYQYKQFTYSFTKVILQRIGHEMKHNNTDPLLRYTALALPAIVASDVLKGTLLNGGELPAYMHSWSPTDFVWHGIERSGLTGLGTFALDAGDGDIGALLGPNVNQVLDLIGQDPARTAFEAAPGLNQLKALRPAA